MRLSCLRDLFDDAGFKKSLKFVLKDKFLTLESTYSNNVTKQQKVLCRLLAIFPDRIFIDH